MEKEQAGIPLKTQIEQQTPRTKHETLLCFDEYLETLPWQKDSKCGRFGLRKQNLARR